MSIRIGYKDTIMSKKCRQPKVEDYLTYIAFHVGERIAENVSRNEGAKPTFQRNDAVIFVAELFKFVFGLAKNEMNQTFCW
jgi:hypothetical protein